MSNNMKRILVGIIGIPLFLFLIYMGGYYFYGLSLVIQTICIWEFLKMFENREIKSLKILTIIISIAVFILLEQKFFFGMALLLLPVIFESFREKNRNPLNPIVSVFSIIYITIPLVFLNEMEKNYLMVFDIFVMIWACDTFAYFGGKLYGKHKLTSISPKKTIEGSLTGLAFTVIASLGFYYAGSNLFNLIDTILIGLITGVFSQIGDNFESLLKRYTDVKDSSNIIPGHGGLLDRFDSLIFVVPIIYTYLNIFK
ncbi:MAG: phosphatidate cytidylyltransferase [Ignavibacteriae bacterium]|nr:phosphatidate cytidylyltransferase [Ignavibacteriota bacterium]